MNLLGWNSLPHKSLSPVHTACFYFIFTSLLNTCYAADLEVCWAAGQLTGDRENCLQILKAHKEHVENATMTAAAWIN